MEKGSTHRHRRLRTCGGQGHPAILKLLLLWGALVGSRGSYGKGGGGREGTAGVVQFTTRGHHDSVVVVKEWELCGEEGADPQPFLSPGRHSGSWRTA